MRKVQKASDIECILFFDEADSLFGKRTNVSDSKDRYANLETSYLLQRLEEYEGITILATNLIKNIDLAFKRRFQYIIPFTLPDESERKKIWKSVIPKTMPVSPNIDFDYLANQFQLNGSRIKSIVLSSAFMAASNHTELNMKLILCAIKEELSKNSEAIPNKNFRQYEDK